MMLEASSSSTTRILPGLCFSCHGVPPTHQISNFRYTLLHYFTISEPLISKILRRFAAEKPYPQKFEFEAVKKIRAGLFFPRYGARFVTQQNPFVQFPDFIGF